jgi:hypothetical protein
MISKISTEGDRLSAYLRTPAVGLAKGIEETNGRVVASREGERQAQCQPSGEGPVSLASRLTPSDALLRAWSKPQVRAAPCNATGLPRNRLAIISKIGIEEGDHAVTLPL